jgi:cytosine deaminase
MDLVLRQCRLGNRPDPVDIGVAGGRIIAIEPQIAADADIEDVGGRLVLPGFVDSHIHLDKACLLDRCGHDHGDLGAAIRAVSAAKRDFTEDDVHARGARVLEQAIVQGTTRIRTHVEVDPRVGLRSFQAIRRLKRDYAWAVDLSICVFPQEGLTNDPGTEELLVEALEIGADALGGCPYTDTDPNEQIARLFALARRFDLDLDFHVDFDLDPSWTHLEEIARQTDAHAWGGRVAIGHVTKLSAMPPEQRDAMARRLAATGIAVTVLPATDLYLMGRAHDRDVPRGVTPAHILAGQGVTCSIATNNVLNPFTPFGDCSLLRMANLYANVAHAGPGQFTACLDLVTAAPARLMNLRDYGIAPGNPADFVVLEATDAATALAVIAQPLVGFKHGRRSFRRPAPVLFR